MAQQSIVTKPYVEELQASDSLFINHNGALRQVSVINADLASAADLEMLENEVSSMGTTLTRIEGGVLIFE